jgi:hypothetical protein
MCDYSLHGLRNRLAIEGERLVTHRFGTGSIGLASPWDIANHALELSRGKGSWWSAVKRWLDRPLDNDVPAVCIPPGARLLMHSIPDNVQRELKVRPVEEVTFVQLSASPYQYRDAIQLGDRRKVILQDLPEGVLVIVLSLASGEVQPEAVLVPYPAAY